MNAQRKAEGVFLAKQLQQRAGVNRFGFQSKSIKIVDKNKLLLHSLDGRKGTDCRRHNGHSTGQIVLLYAHRPTMWIGHFLQSTRDICKVLACMPFLLCQCFLLYPTSHTTQLIIQRNGFVIIFRLAFYCRWLSH